MCAMNILTSQFLRFSLVGIVSTTTTYATLIVSVEKFGIGVLTASTTGYILGAIINYMLNVQCTFNSNRDHLVLIPRFIAVVAAGMLVNVGVMHASVNWLSMNYILAQLVAVSVVLFWSFTASRLWIFSS